MAPAIMLRFDDDAGSLDPLPAEYLAEPDRYFREWIPRRLADDPTIASRFGDGGVVAEIRLTGDRGGTWQFALGGGRVAIESGSPRKPAFTVTMPVDTWRALRQGQVTGWRAFLRGELTISGSKLAALKVARKFR